MQSLDATFSQRMLVGIHKLVRKHFPRVLVKSPEIWTYNLGRDHWEFHGPDKFYWHGSAGGAYDCRCQGWMAWLKAKGIDVDAE